MELAELSGRSLATFKRDFQIEFACSPSKWLQLRRLQFAKELLLSSNHKITEIALEAGFESASHFSRVYKAQFGHSTSVALSRID
ncbi:MAG: Exoenzyme S synthesis regulatory protein ExsA [candidate division WS2 bacterium]|uniref:Exoenzyme S synthesis regulatory protein ExsA n=1 Tax=Psychracetigena formicireducens TaxID=2986056 RepID=A0A9E2BI19_PSYF1|nr:Exoenzyme S synthesis regulatory protein ExsA [Candidatus Psychracetigena formicireducens]